MLSAKWWPFWLGCNALRWSWAPKGHNDTTSIHKQSGLKKACDQDQCSETRDIANSSKQHGVLSYEAPNKMAATLQTTFSNTYIIFINKLFVFWFKSLFVVSSKQLVSINSCNGLVPFWRQAIAWTNVDPDLWWYMASLGHNEWRTLMTPHNNMVYDISSTCISYRLHII